GGRGLCPHGDGPLVTQLAAVVAPSDSPTGIVAETRPKCRTVGRRKAGGVLKKCPRSLGDADADPAEAIEVESTEKAEICLAPFDEPTRRRDTVDPFIVGL
ncbi:hypothetical protein HPB47_022056, partial [Ixodes persulcatus]